MEKGQNNVAFNCFFQIGDVNSCINVLVKTGRAPEAALFARTYAPSAVPATVKTWKKSLEASGKQKISQTLADPEDGDEELFEEGWADAVAREKNGGQSTGATPATNGEAAPEPYEVKEDGESSPPADTETSATGVIEDLVEKAKEMIVGDNAEETEAGTFLLCGCQYRLLIDSCSHFQKHPPMKRQTPRRQRKRASPKKRQTPVQRRQQNRKTRRTRTNRLNSKLVYRLGPYSTSRE